MKIMDMRHVRTYFDSEECEYDRFITRYFSEIPELDAVFDAYCRWKAKERLPYEQQVYQLAPGKPVFSAIMTPAWENDHGNVEGFYNDLREVVGDRRPAFVNGALVNWHFRSERVKDIFHSKTEDMVFVTPSQLADLYRQHCQV
jgi:hypothetical protein